MTLYQSIYRKWRPQFFEDIVGQEHITKTLRNAIKLNRIAHAYIFSGPRGVGKTTTARILAKALNCQNGPIEHPCNNCAQCIRISNSQSMDVIEIDGASNRGIDEIRELKNKMGFVPTEGKYKVYIIDEVHMLTNEAFNALLKTLEEPPPQVLFIFATTAPQKVPKTILSRCQCFHFRRISIDEVVKKLEEICKSEKINFQPSSLALIAESATGSLRDAESILDQVVVYGEGDVSIKDVKEILGVIPNQLFFSFIQMINLKDTRGGIRLLGDIVREGIDLSQFVQDLILYVHQLSLIKLIKDQKCSERFSGETNQTDLNKLAKSISMNDLFKLIEQLNDIEQKIKYHPLPWILLELLVIQLTYQSPETNEKTESFHSTRKSVEEIVQKKKSDVSKPVEIINKETGKKEILEEEKEMFTFDQLWLDFLNRIRKEKISLYAFLTANDSVCLERNKLSIGFRPDCLFHLENLEKRENKQKIESILKDMTGKEIQLKCYLEKKSQKTSEISKRITKKDVSPAEEATFKKNEQKNKEINKENFLNHDKILREAKNLFGGKIIEE